nr:cyclic pyranopterin monophosphate synthase MoaC [Actinomycetes bacterium]
GHLNNLVDARRACGLPLLRKDFIIDEIQVDQARAYGADAVLLIMRAVRDEAAKSIMNRAKDLGMEVVVEINDQDDLARAKKLRPKMLLINNRNLNTLKVNMDTVTQLAPLIDTDKYIVIGASGYGDRQSLDLATARGGVNVFLIGEMLMRQKDSTGTIVGLLKNAPKSRRQGGKHAVATSHPMNFSHLNAAGNVHMVDVGGKPETQRVAIATAEVVISEEAMRLLRSERLKKGDVLATARTAGIMAAKRTSERIPLCHSIPLTHSQIDFHIRDAQTIGVRAECHTVGKTGVEIEAMDAAGTAALTIYDMVKSVDRSATIQAIRLEEKSGGKSGHWQR